jgi:protease-4
MKGWFSKLFEKKESGDTLNNIEGLPEDREVQVAMANVVLKDIIIERRRERTWKLLKRAAFSLMFLIGVSYWFMLKAKVEGWDPIPRASLVGVVTVDGEISDSSLASADKIIPALKKAFEAKNVKAVVIQINSGGGAPVEAERINYIIDEWKVKYKKPVFAVINNVGASAAYMIALHADKIYAGRYSIVGSIGAVMSTWDVHQALEKYDVHRKVYASGELKAMLDPFTAPTEAAEAKAHEMVSIVGKRFANDLFERRGKSLIEGVKYDTGEIWDGETALELGLIDGIGTVESVAAQFPDTKTHDFGPQSPGSLFFKSEVGDWAKSTVTEAVRGAITEAPTLR